MEASLPPDSLFLGFDCSTQSLKATVLDANLKIFATEVVNFDTELPHYKTKGGVYRDPLINGRIVSPPLMWVEALDLVLDRLEKSKLDFERVVAVSGSAQQHGSVYWKNGSFMVLASLDSKKPLVVQLCDAFPVEETPIWMDCSTSEQCKAIEKAVGVRWSCPSLLVLVLMRDMQGRKLGEYMRRNRRFMKARRGYRLLAPLWVRFLLEVMLVLIKLMGREL